jgi:hypothetical protein
MSKEIRVMINKIKNFNIINENTNIKKDVDFVYQQHPELSTIGTQQQYSQYLDTIFPYSKVKDIVYRGDNINYQLPEKNNVAVYSTLNKNVANRYGERLISALINLVNPHYVNDTPQYYWNRIIDKSDRLSVYDGVIYNKGNEILSYPNNTHILGSKQDIEGFKKFIDK